MDRICHVSDNEQVDIVVMEVELASRKAALAVAKLDLQKRFFAFADEKAYIEKLEKSLATAHRLC